MNVLHTDRETEENRRLEVLKTALKEYVDFCDEIRKTNLKDATSCSVARKPLTLHLVLTRHWFDEMVESRKHVEYRAMTPHWNRLIRDRMHEITDVRFSRGYTAETILRPVTGIDIGPCPYDGWDGDYYRIYLGPISEHKFR